MPELTPLAVQLYSLRESMQQDLPGTVRQVAEIGYLGVEPFGLSVDTARQQAALFNDLGLSVPSIHHGRLPLGADKEEVLQILDILGCDTLICPSQPPDDYKTADGVKSVVDRLNASAAALAGTGMRFGYHNHWWEFTVVDGKPAYEYMIANLDPAVLLQVDTYWVSVSGNDVVDLVQRLGSRAPILHIKDGPIDPPKPHLAVGDGNMDIPGLVEASQGSAEWFVVELDECATDMMTAVRQSYEYLTEEGLARGR